MTDTATDPSKETTMIVADARPQTGEPRLASVASWAVLVASFGLSAVTWVALAEVAGYTGSVAGGFRQAWLMPVAVDGYVVTALVLWMSPVPVRVAEFARVNTYAAAFIGVAAQSAFHCLTVYAATHRVGMAVLAAVVGALPPAGAALAVHMRALIRREAGVSAAREDASRVAEERAAELAAAVAQARGERAAEVAELAAQVASLDASLQAAEEQSAADREVAAEALQKALADLAEARREARRKGASGASKKPVERAPRRSEDEWVELAKERLPEWQIETPTGSVIGSALDLSSAGTISKIRQRLEADRLSMQGGK